MGWASSAKKNVLIFIDKNYHQSELIRFIDTVTPAVKVNIDTCNGYKTIENKILDAINKYFGE